jgi:Transposase DDE domain group 1
LSASWKTARHVVAKVEFHFGELFPRVGFIVTNLEMDSRAVVRFYNKRGTAEQWIKEGKQAVKMTRLSCHRFRSNEVRLWLSVLAYNLGNLWRRLVLAEADRQLVADELTAAVGQDRRSSNQARPILLAAAGGESSDAAVVWKHGAQDRGAAGAHRISCGRKANRAKEGSGWIGV